MRTTPQQRYYRRRELLLKQIASLQADACWSSAQFTRAEELLAEARFCGLGFEVARMIDAHAGRRAGVLLTSSRTAHSSLSKQVDDAFAAFDESLRKSAAALKRIDYLISDSD